MRAGKTGSMAAVLMCTLLLGGCGMIGEKPWEPKETALDMKKNGTVSETVIDQLDQSYYNADELKSMVESSVSEYNQVHGADAIRIDSLMIEGGQVKLTMTYASAEDYADYNNVRFYNGSMLGAEIDGYLFYNQFRQVDDGQVTADGLSNEEALKHKEYQVLVTDMSHIVRVPGDVVYVSANASPMSAREVRPTDTTTSSAQEGLVLPSSAVYTEVENEPVTAKDLEKTYLYIIYEF